MKRRDFILGIVPFACLPGMAAADRTPAAVAKLRKSVDDIKGETFYQDSSSPTYANSPTFMIYIGASKDAKWLRFRTTYAGDDWLFVQRFTVKADDYLYESPVLPFERDNNNGVWEWIDVPAEYLLPMLTKVSLSKKAVLRFEGRHYRKDRIITDKEKQAIRNIFTAYAALPGK